MTIALMFIAFAGGYAASIYSWPAVRNFITGAEAEIRSLQDRINKIKAGF